MRTILWAVAVMLGGATAATGQITVQLSEQDCGRLVRHVASDDVAYRPGVDVDGNAVAPADLDDRGSIPDPNVVVFPLTLDLASRLGIPPGGNADYLARPVIGVIAITRDGRASFNGIPLTSDAQHELAELCQRVDKSE